MFSKTCKKCGAEASFLSKTCPQCGARMPKATTAERFQVGCMVLVLIWFGIVIIGGVYWLIDRPF